MPAPLTHQFIDIDLNNKKYTTFRMTNACQHESKFALFFLWLMHIPPHWFPLCGALIYASAALCWFLKLSQSARLGQTLENHKGQIVLKALEALHSRTSSPRLCDPAPNHEQLDSMFRAALRAADHGLLRPWRFLLIRGEARNRLGDLFVEAAIHENSEISEAQREKLRKKPLRAPLIVVTISSPQPHPKVPEFEQDLSAAAATQNMINAAYAVGVGAMWRSGSPAFQDIVHHGLGLQGNEKIIGFLYLGTLSGPAKPSPNTDYSEYVTEW